MIFFLPNLFEISKMSHDLPTDDICIYINMHVFVCVYTPREGTCTCQGTGTNTTAVCQVQCHPNTHKQCGNHGQNIIQAVNVAPPHPGTW